MGRRKSIKLMPGVRMTVSKSGVSYSAGGKGFRVTKTASGRVTRTVGIPGTGISHTSTVGSRPRSAPGSKMPRPPAPAAPVKPGLFAPKAEKAMFKAVRAQDWTAIEQVGRDHPDYSGLIDGLIGLRTSDNAIARELLERSFTGSDPASHPFARKYLHMDVTLEIVPGVRVELPVGRDAIGLTLAEIHQEAGDIDAAIAVVEQLDGTTISALSLAELYSQAGRHADVIELTEGVTNDDDATSLLCAFRGVAFREQGFLEASREAFKEALRFKKRDPAVRHRALLERAGTYLAEDRKTMAKKDLERILAEDSDYPGLRELLQQFAVEPA